MANQSTDKALLGFAMSSNSLLQKIEAIETQTSDTLLKIESVMVSSLSVTQGIAAGISESNKILKEIKEIISKKSEAEKAQFGGSSGMAKLLGLGGFIALTGIGMFGLALAFQEAGKVTPAAIASGVAMFVALAIVAKLIGGILQDPSSAGLFSNLKVMKTFTLTMGLSMITMVAMSYALAQMAPVGGTQLITALAIGTVIYLMGQTFVQLIKAWEFSGIMNFMLNKNNTDDIMRAMFLMTIQTVILAGAMNLMPNVNQQTAINFVIMSAAMIPLAAALTGMRFALAGIQQMDLSGIGKMGVAIAMLGLALIPIALSAKAISKLSVTEEEIKRVTSMTVALAPLVAMIGFFTAVINITKQSREGKANASLLKQDNSRKRRAELKPKEIKNFALQSLAIIGAIALLAITLKYAGPMMVQGINAAAAIDPVAAFKMITIMGAILLIGGLVIGMTVNMIKGKNKKSTGSLIPGMGSSSETRGKISTNDIYMAAIILPVIAIGMALTAYALKMMPSTLPKLGMDFLVFSALSGLGLLIFGQALGRTARLLGKVDKDDVLMTSLIIPVLALTILATALLFQALPSSFNSPDLMFTFKAGLAVFIFGAAVAKISKMLKRVAAKDLAKGVIVTLTVAVLISAVAFLFSSYPGDPTSMPSFKFIALASLAVLAFAAPLALITYLVRNVKAITLLKGALASAIIALSIVGVAFLFSYLSSVGAFVAPPYDWSMKAGLALLVFGLGYAGVALLTKALGISTMLQGIIGVAVIALAILAVGWIFNMLNGVGFVAPPFSWSVAVALSLLLFTVPALAIGLIATTGIGAVGLLLGVVGMIVIAAGIWVVAWIFNKMPDVSGVAKMLTDAMLAPVNGIVDILGRLKNEIGVENLLPLAGGIIAISVSLLALAGATAGLAAGGIFASVANVGKAFFDGVAEFFGGEKSKGPLDILEDIVRMAPQLQKVAKPIEQIGRAVSFLMGGPDMRVMSEFIYVVSNHTPKKEIAEFIKSIAPPFNSMMDALSRLNEDPIKRLRALFFDVPWKSIHEPVRSVAESMTILAESAMAAGRGVMLTANGMNIMVDALNRLTKENIDAVIKLFNEVNWAPLVDPINSISTAIHKMSINADKLGIGMKMSANALILMSTISAEILKEIAAVFDSLAKSDLTKQGEAMLYNIAPSLASISATMLVMRSDAYIRMFEVMASSSEAIVAMSKPMTRIASAMDKMGMVNIDGIEWAHKMARQLARSSFNNQATALEKMAKSYKDISKSSNSMNVEAINATTDMFKALAYLYKNGRKNAMEELGEKLTEAVRELARMIADFEGTVNSQAEGSKTVGEAMAKAVDGLTEAVGLTPSGNSGNNIGGGNSLSNLQELIDLLQSGQAKITITDLDPAAEAKLA